MVLNTIPRAYKKAMLMLMDIGIFAMAIWVAFAVRTTTTLPEFNGTYFKLLLIISFVRIPVFIKLGLYRSFLRFPSERILSISAQGVAISTVFVGTALYLADLKGEPRAVLLIEPFVSFFLVLSSRQLIGKQIFKLSSSGLAKRERIIIYGAGLAGIQMAQSMRVMEGLKAVAFIDDNPSKWNMLVADIKVFPPSALTDLAKKHNVRRALIAAPSSSSVERRKMVFNLRKAGLEHGEMPNFLDIINGNVKIEDLFHVNANDLLQRETVEPNRALLKEVVSNNAVMITGAGGSIGAELSRQIAALEPSRLVLFDSSEFALYSIDMEVRQMYPGLKVVPILGSVLNEKLVLDVITSNAVATVYHTAAYKHVPLVEGNPIEGVRNNVIGTKTVAEACAVTNVKHFVLVSTDKAVRPTNVMGASKRVAELACHFVASQAQQIQVADGVLPVPTKFSAVRFGNVIDSAGSVVPLFRKQIAEGGPLTVTHEDVTRFFMTIPEASQLVIQASAMSNGGEVFLLDMGEPIRVYDLAQRMINLATRDNEREIKIKITGLRPGEKLYEELLVDASTSEETTHKKIYKSLERGPSLEVVREQLLLLDAALNEQNLDSVLAVLQELVEGYSENSLASN
ncbi:MAG: nucleoside-diphosphate sugar epimerase/dehydratase [Planctomycetota bacterium]|nr:nucleoside-diphosphate sugar epimerase/dehydratase [Planctomycetota bacterium]